MLHRLATMTFAVLAALVFAAPALADDAHKGTIESVGADSLVMKIEGKAYRFSVGEETTIRLNGEEAELSDLKKGQSATVTAKKEGQKLVATKIEAKAAEERSFRSAVFADAEDAADAVRGRIESVGKDNLVLNAGGKRFKFHVGEEATITLNGEEAKLADLKKGQSATVTAKKEGEKLVATKVEARAAKADSAPTGAFFAAADDDAAEAVKGEIESVGEDSMVLNVDGKRFKFSVGEEATITLDGEKATLKELKKGQMATVTAKAEGGKLTATKIEAKSA